MSAIPPQSFDLWSVAALASMPAQKLQSVLSGEPQEAARLVAAAARWGIVEAQLRFGRMLLAGEGVAQDEAQAFAWFSRAAQSDDAEALNMVGRCHENGWGTAQSLSRAAEFYLRAAEAGHAWAQYNLGHLFLDGSGVERDPARAFHWYALAAKQGHERAMNLVARCHEEGWGTPRDAALAREWYRRSAEGGYFRGTFNYATILAAEGNISEAQTWFEKAIAGAPEPTRTNMTKALEKTAMRTNPA